MDSCSSFVSVWTRKAPARVSSSSPEPPLRRPMLSTALGGRQRDPRLRPRRRSTPLGRRRGRHLLHHVGEAAPANAVWPLLMDGHPDEVALVGRACGATRILIFARARQTVKE